MRLISVILVFWLAACAQFPALDNAVSDQALASDYPTLAPVDDLLAAAQPSQTDPVQTVATLNVRIAALRNRANRLRGAVVDRRTRTRMASGIN